MNKSIRISISVFAIIAITLISFGVYLLSIAENSSQWVKTPAKVISYNITQSNIQRRGVFKKRKYDIQITYHYKFNQVTYTNKTISFGKGNTLKSEFKEREVAHKWIKNSEFARSKLIDIYVNPDNPNESVVYTGMNFFTFIPLLIGLFFLTLSLLAFKGSKKNSKEEKTTAELDKP